MSTLLNTLLTRVFASRSTICAPLTVLALGVLALLPASIRAGAELPASPSANTAATPPSAPSSDLSAPNWAFPSQTRDLPRFALQVPPPKPADAPKPTDPAKPADPAKPGFGEAAPEDPDVVWDWHDGTGLLTQHPGVSIISPFPYMKIRNRGESDKNKQLWIIKPLKIKLSGNLDQQAVTAFETKDERWPSQGGTGSIRRYATDPWVETFNRYKAKPADWDAAVLICRRMDMRAADAREERELKLKDMDILCFPQTWENIWIAQVVTGVPAESRLDTVEKFDAAFKLRIENKEAKDKYFSPEQQRAYASFYQSQFAWIRDKQPQSAAIYDRLAQFHAKRDNIDAQLSVYLDAIQNEVPPVDLARFRLRAGEILVRRLGLYAEAIQHLALARDYADARLLLVECYLRLRRYPDAKKEADELIARTDKTGTKEAPQPAPSAADSGTGSAPSGTGATSGTTPTAPGAPTGTTTAAAPTTPELPADQQPLLAEADGTAIKQHAQLLGARAVLAQAASTEAFNAAYRTIEDLIKAVGDGSDTAPPPPNPPSVPGAKPGTPQPPKPLPLTTMRDEAVYIFASMRLFRGEASEAAKLISSNKTFEAFIKEAKKPAPNYGLLPYDPLACEALALYAHATFGGKPGAVSADAGKILDFAQATDPLSPEPQIVRGKLAEGAAATTNDWASPREAYEKGLLSNPANSRLNYLLGMLYLREGKDGSLQRAESLFNTSLAQEPDYYPALNGLGEIMLARSDSGLRTYEASALSGDAASREAASAAYSSALREAAASYSAGLDIMPRQHTLRASLAALYTRMATFYDRPDPALSVSYLRRALSLAAEVVRVIEKRIADGAVAPGLFEDVPPVAAYTVFAYASYRIGVRTSDRHMIDDAINALETHRSVATDARYFTSVNEKDAYVKSNAYRWGLSSLVQIVARQRQKLQRETFDGLDSRELTQLGRGWQVHTDDADEGALKQIWTGGGDLHLGVDKQKRQNFTTWVSRDERFTHLKSFTANMKERGKGGIARGIFLTAVQVGDDGSAAVAWSLLFGFDSANNLFWDIRGKDDKGNWLSALPDGPVIIAPAAVGLEDAIDATPVQLSLERDVPGINESQVVYTAYVGGIEGRAIRIDLGKIAQSDFRARMESSANIPAEAAVGWSIRIGCFVEGRTGAAGSMDIPECAWVIDSNLANIRTE